MKKQVDDTKQKPFEFKMPDYDTSFTFSAFFDDKEVWNDNSAMPQDLREFIYGLANSHDALLEEAKEARTLLKHLIRFLKFQRPGKEFYPNREAGEACITKLEFLIAQAEKPHE